MTRTHKTKKIIKNNKKITDFFEQDQLLIDTSIEKNSANTVSDFYTTCVKEKLKHSKCERQTCAQEKQKLQQHLAHSKDKLEQTKKAIDTCKRILEQKDHEIRLLKIQLNDQCHIEHGKKTEELLFSSYKNDFTSAGLSTLRSMAGEQPEDSNFVLTGMRFLYQGQLHRLGSISLSGRSKNKSNDNVKSNEKMSPKKVNAMKGVFTERLNAMKLEEEVYKQRATRINILINNAIQNLNSKKNCKQELDELNDQLNSTENC